jgi:hypothetical protein
LTSVSPQSEGGEYGSTEDTTEDSHETPNFFASTKFFACLELEESQVCWCCRGVPSLAGRTHGVMCVLVACPDWLDAPMAQCVLSWRDLIGGTHPWRNVCYRGVP